MTSDPRDDLDHRLQAHFAGAQPDDPPPFDATLAAARARQDAESSRRHRRRWPSAAMASAALASAAVLAALLAPQLLEPERSTPAVLPDTELLLAELTTTTRWRAPSDRWLAQPQLPAQGIPDLDHLTYEVKTWP